MFRTQVYLPEDIYQDLRFLAGQQQSNISQLIRQGAKIIIAQNKAKKNMAFTNIVGKGKGKAPKDLAENFDDYLYGSK